MSPDPMFKTLKPRQLYVCTRPNPVEDRSHLRTPRISVRVLDSPVAFTGSGLPKIAAMIVPDQRETDWNFCTNTGHLQLLYNYPNLSRLILISNDLPTDQCPSIYIPPPVTDNVHRKKLEEELQPLVMSLHPQVCFQNGSPKPLFLTYEDDLLYREIKATLRGPIVGEFVVEDVLLEVYDDSVDKKLRRNLRFKRMPDYIQSQFHLFPVDENGKTVTELVNLENLQQWKKKKNVTFVLDTELLVHSYLTPMVTGLLLISSHLNERIEQGFTPRALCLGVGGGALLTFLNTKLGFEVVGVEADKVVLSAAEQYFGFNKSGSIQVIVGDAIDVIQNFPSQLAKGNTNHSDSKAKIDGVDAKFDVVMVDLDSSDSNIAPPEEFVKKSVFQAVRLLLHDHGILIINVDPLNDESYRTLVDELMDVFHSVFEIDVEDENNFVLMATLSPATTSSVYDLNDFAEKLRRYASVEGHMEAIGEFEYEFIN